MTIRLIAAILGLALLLPGLPALAQSKDFEREVRRTECQTEAFAEYSDETQRCLDELSSATDECSDIEDFKRRMRCKRSTTRDYERCGKSNQRRYDREERRCASLD